MVVEVVLLAFGRSRGSGGRSRWLGGNRAGARSSDCRRWRIKDSREAALERIHRYAGMTESRADRIQDRRRRVARELRECLPDTAVGEHPLAEAIEVALLDRPTGDQAQLSPVGDRLMTACLIAGGLAPEQAADFARSGGLYTLEHDALRIQCIWKTDEGGNHHDHLHAGARRL